MPFLTYSLNQNSFKQIHDLDFNQLHKFNVDIELVHDGETILNTGGGILNMINSSNESDFLTLNPDTVWNNNYVKHIQQMEKIYFSNQSKNILLLVKKNLSFDKKLNGDFNLIENKIKKDDKNDFIYTGCQIINKSLFDLHVVNSFSILEVWNKLLKEDMLYGYESLENFYHLTNLKIYKELLKNQ